MVNYCCAYNCSATSDVFPGVIFHSFPMKNPEMLQKWVIALKRKNFKPSAGSKICSSHFKPTDYNPPVICGPPRLKKDAVPSIFDFPDHLMLKQSNRRVLQRVLPSSTSENIEPMVEESRHINYPVDEVVKKSCVASTQTS